MNERQEDHLPRLGEMQVVGSFTRALGTHTTRTAPPFSLFLG